MEPTPDPAEVRSAGTGHTSPHETSVQFVNGSFRGERLPLGRPEPIPKSTRRKSNFR
ncbi:MAG: hypothetical protein P8K78_04530 [Pirellulales bacterium]|nr:hypothetical protein [Pirellulales bacterium]